MRIYQVNAEGTQIHYGTILLVLIIAIYLILFIIDGRKHSLNHLCLGKARQQAKGTPERTEGLAKYIDTTEKYTVT